jgi:hypothetical protein
MPTDIRQATHMHVHEINPEVEMIDARIVRGRVELGSQ